MITGGDLRQSRLDVGYKTFTISPCHDRSDCLLKTINKSILIMIVILKYDSFVYYLR